MVGFAHYGLKIELGTVEQLILLKFLHQLLVLALERLEFSLKLIVGTDNVGVFPRSDIGWGYFWGRNTGGIGQELPMVGACTFIEHYRIRFFVFLHSPTKLHNLELPQVWKT